MKLSEVEEGFWKEYRFPVHMFLVLGKNKSAKIMHIHYRLRVGQPSTCTPDEHEHEHFPVSDENMEKRSINCQGSLF